MSERKCPACENVIGTATTLDEMVDLMGEHLDVCLPSRQIIRALRNGTLVEQVSAPLPTKEDQ